MPYRYEELAKMIDHALLHPTLTDADLEAGCHSAAKYGVASVCVKPYFVKRAAELLTDSGVLVGTVIGFPHGSNLTEVKRLETDLACRDGAAEVDMVINIGKAISGDWDYVQADIQTVADEAHSHGAKLKVILENDLLSGGGSRLDADSLKQKLCQICEAAGANWVKTSTGFGFVKQAGGGYNYQGATQHDLRLMKAAVSNDVQVKASGGVRDLAGLIRVRELGATRCGTSATAQILDAYDAYAKSENDSPSEGKLGSGGY